MWRRITLHISHHISRHPFPEKLLGEEVAAVIVLRPGRSLTEKELQDFLSGTIAKHKIPTKIWFRDEPIPRNASGKFLKRELKKELTGE